MKFSPVTNRLGEREFIALIAMLFATIAFSIDAMLPAEPAIIAEFTPDAPNLAKLVIGSFFLGMGIGTFFSGPLSDRFGRKPIILIGAAIYSIAAILCWFAQSLEMLLAARLIQGIGAAGPRTVALAMVRDLYKGREMARIMSFAMMIFMLIPAVSPFLGQQIIYLAGWHAIFLVFVVFSLISALWLALRQPETLPKTERRALTGRAMLANLREMFSYRVVVVSVMIQALTQAVMVGTISSVQGIFSIEFGIVESFPAWFALAALVAASGSLLNSRIVMSLGMRKVAATTYAVVLVISILHLLLLLGGMLEGDLKFAVFFFWLISLFCMLGLTMGNLNALAMEPVGHIAGFAASVMAAVSTVISVALSTPIAQAFDGTHRPLLIGSVIFLGLSLALMRFLKR